MLTNRLGREVAAVTAIKVAIIVAASILVFGDDHRPIVTPDVVQKHLISATADSAEKESLDDRP